MKVRKQVYDLTPADLQLSPVWQFALDEDGQGNQDESTARPLDHLEEIGPEEDALIVKAEFTLADGSRFEGYLTPVPGSLELADTQPTIVTARGQVMFWLGMYPRENELKRAYTALGKTAAEVFPVRFTSAVAMREPISGELAGFMRLEDPDTLRCTVLT